MKNVHACARTLALANTETKNNALLAIATALEDSRPILLEENGKDIQAGQAKGLSDALIDRLTLNDQRIAAMIEGLNNIIALPDPIGEITEKHKRPTGICVGKMRVPLGVIGIIYESRPNVTADAAALCLKSGNATILRGGSEAIYSNRAIAQCIATGLEKAGLPQNCIQLIPTTDRAAVSELLKCDEYIDIIIPRGGKSLIELIMSESKIPLIKHLDGICHTYIDATIDMDKALAIALNAKTQRYGVCNAMETLLIDASIAPQFLPQCASALQEKGVELRGCEQSRKIIAGMKPASEEDWRTEYLAPILSIRVVAGLDEAIEHIEMYGSHHTDVIVTDNKAHADRFIREVDSSSVMVNASSRFADGFEYGLGAEIGISTDRLHARGPVGLHGLTTQKYVVFGCGQIRQ